MKFYGLVDLGSVAFEISHLVSIGIQQVPKDQMPEGEQDSELWSLGITFDNGRGITTYGTKEEINTAYNHVLNIMQLEVPKENKKDARKDS